MAFTLRQLEIFAEAARDENFRKTADRLGMAQPSISKHIKALEREAGGELFRRMRGSAARLTPLGTEMVSRARSMLRMAGKLYDAGHAALPLRVAAGGYILDHWLRPSLRNLLFEPDMPEIAFLRADDRDAVIGLLRAGEADCGFYHGEPADSAQFASRVLRSSTVGLYAAPAIAARVRGRPENIGSFPFVLSSAGSKAEIYQRAQLEAAGFVPRYVAGRSEYADYQLELVRAGHGIGLLFDDDTQPAVLAGELERLPFAFAPGSRCMVISLAAPPAPRFDRAIELMCNVLAQPAGGR